MEDLFPSLFSGGPEEPLEFLIGKAPLGGPEGGALDAEGCDSAFAPVHVGQEGVEGGKHGIGAVCLVFFLKVFFIFHDAHFIEGRFFPQPLAEGLDVPEVFVNGYVAPFMVYEHFLECSHVPFINRVLHCFYSIFLHRMSLNDPDAGALYIVYP